MYVYKHLQMHAHNLSHMYSRHTQTNTPLYTDTHTHKHLSIHMCALSPSRTCAKHAHPITYTCPHIQVDEREHTSPHQFPSAGAKATNKLETMYSGNTMLSI